MGELAIAIEDFNTIFIRLPAVRRLNFSALSVLHMLERRGPLRLTDLLATEQLKQPALTSLIAKLAEDGLVSRRPDPSDGRAVLLSLAPDGVELMRSRRTERVANLTRLVDQLSDEEREVLAGTARVFNRLVEIASEEKA
jgi:DNA-binding MarR family transcriptional regulator